MGEQRDCQTRVPTHRRLNPAIVLHFVLCLFLLCFCFAFVSNFQTCKVGVRAPGLTRDGTLKDGMASRGGDGGKDGTHYIYIYVHIYIYIT